MPSIRKMFAALLLLSPAALLPAGCDSVECKTLLEQICEHACDCGGCHYMPGNIFLTNVDQCVISVTVNVCTEDTDSDMLEACEVAIAGSVKACPYMIPKPCLIEGAFEDDPPPP